MAKVLVAKVGLDGHDRGALLVARALRDAGHEAVYTGLHRTPDEVARMAAEEHADVVAVGILSGAHMVLMPALLAALEEHGHRPPVVFGGIVSEEETALLLEMGVAAVFPPDRPISEVVATIAGLAA
ncbi:cobalamin-dependent protein [bacterium]|nr:cobalamin-dependent protein [bacterium]